MQYGVYPHAEWNYETNKPELTGGGWVVREMTNAVPYSRMTPVRVYTRRHAAERLSDKLTYGDR